jgi:cytochrome c peroxidase
MRHYQHRVICHPILFCKPTRPRRLINRRAHPRAVASCRLHAVVVGLSLVSMQCAQAQETEPSTTPEPAVSLKTVPVPSPSADIINEYVTDRSAIVRLGKALFWDVRVGSDNKTSCASCHFHAGADNRVKNQISPGLLAGDKTFQLGGPNYTLKPNDFPLTRHSDVDNAASRLSDKNDVVGSQGVMTTNFVGSGKPGVPDRCTQVSDAVRHGGSGFNVNGVNTRRVEPRNTPTVFNSVFNFRNFWDGRANNIFNGEEPFGLRNAEARISRLENGIAREVTISLPVSALSSQAIGPPLSENEMSCKNRVFANVGRKLLDDTVLAEQDIAPGDSVLGQFAKEKPTYATLVSQAFSPDLWKSPTTKTMHAAHAERTGNMDLSESRHRNRPRSAQKNDEVTQMEKNFGFFFSVAIQSYLATLISDETPYDRFAAGEKQAMTAQQIRGFELFRGSAQCMHCHANAELTSAATNNFKEDVRLDKRTGPDMKIFRYDNGFFNTGVRPTADDPGVGGTDPFGNPLSETRIAQLGKLAFLGDDFHEESIDPSALTAVDGAFKTPGLRNAEFTGPYFHNGGKSTLKQVVDFYNRGGDFAAENQPIPDPTIKPLGLNEEQKNELVAFLLALSDERVAYEKAPFDHPSICVPHGHEGSSNALSVDAEEKAIDVLNCLPAVGAEGKKDRIPSFLGLDPYQR